jgi:lambda family phage minor tail protein L
MPIREDIQRAGPGQLVALFEVDATELGGEVYRFTSTARENGVVSFGGAFYLPLEVETEGFELTGKGGMPTPKLRMGAQLLSLLSALIGMNDFLGCIFRRIRTFERYLDDGAQPAGDQHLPVDIYMVSKRNDPSATVVEFELKALVDHPNVMLPRRKIYTNHCSWRYRRWNPQTSTWNYTHVTCPYGQRGVPTDDTRLFTMDGTPTEDPAHDVCGKRLSDCLLRFTDTAALPYGGFPAARQ